MFRHLALISVPMLLLASSVGAAVAGPGQGHTSPARCSSGARTLSHSGDHVYPDMGNGGYRSVHTDVHMVYDAPSNQFLPGNHVGADRPGDPVPQRLQPRLRAHVRARRATVPT